MCVVGCVDDVTTDVVVSPADAASVDAVQEADAALEAADSDCTDDGLDEEEDAAIAPLVIGLDPIPADAQGKDEDSQQAEALLMALAAGVRGVVVEANWKALEDDAWWARTEVLSSYLSKERKQLFLSIPVVEARQDGRPEWLRFYSWSSATVRERLRQLLDRVFGTLGSQLSYVSMGFEVDRYLEAYPKDAMAFSSCMAETLQYAMNHDKRQDKTEVGVTWSTSAWLGQEAESAERQMLVGASPTVFLAHHGLDNEQGIEHWQQAVQAIGVAVDAVEAQGRKVVLHRVASTSSTLVGGSEAEQAAFVKGVFELVQAKRSHVAFVGFGMLHDPSPDACLSFARAREPSATAGLYAFWCSAGLRTRQGAAKASFSVFMQEASRFLNP
jgi:hypothetical protein